MAEHDRLFIEGEWVRPAGTAVIEVISPHTEEVIGTVPDGTPDDMDRAVAAARTAFGINTYTVEPAAPFGGVKASGVGRELGPEGLVAYQEYKSVVRAW